VSALYVVFRVGESTYAVAASDVVQLESFTGATKVPGTPSYVAGLVQLRSALVPVVDLRARFGLPPIARALDARIIVVEKGGRRIGLLADGAREIVRIDPSSFQVPPESVLRQANGFIKAIATVSDRIVMLVDYERVIGNEEMHGQPHVEQG
jgi:purine-binding chemotaxis protein CheW